MSLASLIRTFVAASFAVTATSPTYACEQIWEQETPKLPGETDTEYNARLNAFANDVRAVFYFNEQGARLREAKSAYIAVVESASNVDEKGIRKRVSVRPVHPIHGKLPKRDIILVDTVLTSCGMNGDGGATSSKKSELVFVFEGLKVTSDRPRGIASISAFDARHPVLTHALYQYLKIEDPND